MAGRLEGRVAVVIGAGRGIGRAIAERFEEEGALLVLGDRDAELLARTANELGAAMAPCDVAEKADVERLVQRALDLYGRLDVLVQNAGIFPETMLEAIPIEEWDRVLAVNLRGCFLAVQAALVPMRTQRYGRIVLTSSITGPRVVPPGHAHYAASKAGINGLIRAAALEAAPFDVTVNGVEPGNILTEGMHAERSPDFIAAMERSVPLGRLGMPRDVANAVLFLASDEAAYVTGTTIVVDGGQILPESRS
ncbi:SDR family oxidoreductase [Benzoatithermus flavus]|uniref:SDR family oxidoreductase n=1 Tax=Benzoatithermus flavus TaxID=3108223 RepID=A0ABU8XR08_9PROT